MLWIIILLAMALAGIALMFFDDNDTQVMGGALTIIGFSVLILLSISLAGIKSDFQAFKNDYQFTKELLETYEPGIDYGNTSSLASKVLSINNKIAKHRAQCNSPWYNLWRDKEIGELEPLKLPSKKNVEKNETTDN